LYHVDIQADQLLKVFFKGLQFGTQLEALFNMIKIVVTLLILLQAAFAFSENLGMAEGAAHDDLVTEKPLKLSDSNLPEPENEQPRDKDADQQNQYKNLDDLFTLYQPYMGNISPHEPIYFLVGTDPEKSKFQLSLKYRFLNPEGSWSQAHPWLQGFHIAYTQTSYWDLESDSKPFEDTSYKPEFFYRSSNLNFMGRKVTNCFIQTGYQHESNGQGGDNSRATDIFYVRPIFIFYHESSQLGFSVSPKIWGYLSNEDKDLKDYRGYFDLELACGKADSLVAQSSFRWAKEGASIQLDLTYPLREILFENFDIYLQVQYANSLAESLLNFRKRTKALRIGFAIIR